MKSTLLAAVALVAVCAFVAFGADAEAEPTAPVTCEDWQAGAYAPPVVQAICRREALLRKY